MDGVGRPPDLPAAALTGNDPLTEVVADLAADLVALGERLGRRPLVGVTGAPGVGKSTLAAAVAERTGAVVVPMDGFHLDDVDLRRLGRHDRKGAPDTFDAAGYLATLTRLRTASGPVTVPAFDRDREVTVPDAISVPADRPVLTEGNYLLLATPPWSHIRAVLDACWFVHTPDADRVARLVARHIAYGWDPAAAHERATRGSDGDNARLVAATSVRADRIIAWPVGRLAP